MVQVGLDPRELRAPMTFTLQKLSTGCLGVMGSKPAAPTKSFSLTQYLLFNGLYCSALFLRLDPFELCLESAVAAEVVGAQKRQRKLFFRTLIF